jgi:membrane associated rhomboid family serine protease
MAPFTWLPIGTDARVRETPWAVIALGAANLAGFGLVLATRGDPGVLYALAFKPAAPSIPTALTAPFMHAEALPLLLALLFLSVFGPPLESRVGAGRVAIAYLACGWLANLAQAWAVLVFEPDLAAVPITGAAGAVSGLLGLFLVRLHFARLVFISPSALLREGAVRPARAAIPAAAGAALWFALPAAGRWLGLWPEPAPIAYVTGALFGVLLGLILGVGPAGKLERRLARGARHAERGEWHAALHEYESYLGAKPEDPEALAVAARLLRVTHQDAQAADRFRRAIHAWLRRGSLRAACDAYLEMRRLLGSEAALSPVEQLRVARGFEELGRPGEASRAYEAYGREYPERHAAALALLRSADIERRALRNPGRARYLYEELLKRNLPPDLAEMVRERKKVAERALDRRRGAA